MKEPCRIDAYLAALRPALWVRPALRERILGEVEDHLRESAAAEEACGAPRDEAERRAIERFGPVDEVAQWWSEVYTREDGDSAMWQRFTKRARRVVFNAQEEATRLGETYVGTEHLLLGLIREEDCVGARAILVGKLGIPLERIRTEVERQVTPGSSSGDHDMNLTPRAKRVVDLAYEEARSLGNNYIGTEHLLLGLSIEDGGLAGNVLRKLGANAGRLRAAVHEVQQESEGQMAERERLVNRVRSAFQQAVERRTSLSPEVQALIRVLTTADPDQLADAAASYLKLTEADRQELAPAKSPEERLQKLVALLQGEVAFQFPAGGSSEETGAESEDRDTELGHDPEAIVRIAHTVIQQAIQESAEVIRVESRSDCVAVFFRINGVDEEKMKMPTAIRQPLMARYRRMAEMAVDSEGPQQGRIAISHAGRDFDLDVRSEPTPDGERIVITVHEKS